MFGKREPKRYHRPGEMPASEEGRYIGLVKRMGGPRGKGLHPCWNGHLHCAAYEGGPCGPEIGAKHPELWFGKSFWRKHKAWEEYRAGNGPKPKFPEPQRADW